MTVVPLRSPDAEPLAIAVAAGLLVGLPFALFELAALFGLERPWAFAYLLGYALLAIYLFAVFTRFFAENT
jgi:hypothetical protein